MSNAAPSPSAGSEQAQHPPKQVINLVFIGLVGLTAALAVYLYVINNTEASLGVVLISLAVLVPVGIARSIRARESIEAEDIVDNSAPRDPHVVADAHRGAGTSAKVDNSAPRDPHVVAALIPEDDHAVIIIKAANGCERLARHHTERGALFLTAGIVVASIGFVFYISILFQRPEPKPSDKIEADAISRLEIELVRAVNAKSYNLTPSEAEIKRLDDDLNAQRKSIETLRAIEAARDLPKDSERLTLQREIFSVVRSSLAFLFVEVMAGFFLTLSQRHDVQASHWRNHRQVYERLLVGPTLIKRLKDDTGRATVEMELISMIMSPVSAHIFPGHKDANPALAAISSLSDAIREAKNEATKSREKSA